MGHTVYTTESKPFVGAGVTIQAATRAPGRDERFRKGTVIAYLVLGAIVALSSLLPWERMLFVQASGLQVGRGWLVLIGGGVAVGTAGVSLRHGRAITGLRASQFVCAVVAIGMFAAEYAALASACKELTAGTDWFYSASSSSENSTASCVGGFMGIGALVALLSGAALGLLALFRGPTAPTS